MASEPFEYGHIGVVRGLRIVEQVGLKCLDKAFKHGDFSPNRGAVFCIRNTSWRLILAYLIDTRNDVCAVCQRVGNG